MSAISSRHAMLIIGLLQGLLLLALHEWIEAHPFQVKDLLLLAPLYTFVVAMPLGFNFLRGEFTSSKSLWMSGLLATIITCTALWFGWSVPVELGTDAPREALNKSTVL